MGQGGHETAPLRVYNNEAKQHAAAAFAAMLSTIVMLYISVSPPSPHEMVSIRNHRYPARGPRLIAHRSLGGGRSSYQEALSFRTANRIPA